MQRMIGGVVIGLVVLASSGWAIDRAEFDKKLVELKSPDAKVRAAALTELGPLYGDMMFSFMAIGNDKSPEVVAARTELEKQFAAKMEQMKDQAPVGQMRMAANETAAAASCKAFAEAEEIYHRTDYQQSGVLQYSQHLKGDNSLLETKAGNGELALVDKTFANAEGNPGEAKPKAGYCFKVLTKQGASATGGKRDYVMNGHMTLGYALLAYPAEYDKTGRDCFMINNNGTIFQKDMGADTAAMVEKMTEFDPDNTWAPTQ